MNKSKWKLLIIIIMSVKNQSATFSINEDDMSSNESLLDRRRRQFIRIIFLSMSECFIRSSKKRYSAIK